MLKNFQDYLQAANFVTVMQYVVGNHSLQMKIVGLKFYNTKIKELVTE